MQKNDVTTCHAIPRYDYPVCSVVPGFETAIVAHEDLFTFDIAAIAHCLTANETKAQHTKVSIQTTTGKFLNSPCMRNPGRSTDGIKSGVLHGQCCHLPVTFFIFTDDSGHTLKVNESQPVHETARTMSPRNCL